MLLSTPLPYYLLCHGSCCSLMSYSWTARATNSALAWSLKLTAASAVKLELPETRRRWRQIGDEAVVAAEHG
jgi:hypothetical protein